MYRGRGDVVKDQSNLGEDDSLEGTNKRQPAPGRGAGAPWGSRDTGEGTPQLKSRHWLFWPLTSQCLSFQEWLESRFRIEISNSGNIGNQFELFQHCLRKAHQNRLQATSRDICFRSTLPIVISNSSTVLVSVCLLPHD